MNREYWKWEETIWINDTIDWREGEIISAGVDVGSVSTKAAILVDGKLYAYDYIRTGANSPKSANNAMNILLDRLNLELNNIHFIIGTGYGRVNVPFAGKTITEIACHARGAVFIYGNTVRTILDIGGQDTKVIKCDERGKVLQFLMNDKCAAGTGRGLETFADLLNVQISDLGKLSLKVDKEPPPVSNTCVVFAKSEALRLLRQGWSKEKVAAAYHSAMVDRIIELVSRLGLEKDFVVTGGVFKNPGITYRISKRLDVPLLKPKDNLDPALAGAIGAGLFAWAYYKKFILKSV